MLKHRRRKEKAQRKLVNMQANLDRLHDLTDELRKQLGPLARQAEAAQKASAVQATIRSSRVQLAAHKVKQLSEELNDSTRRSEMLAEQRAELQAELEEHSETLAVTEEELRTALEEAEAAKNLWYRLSAVQEKNSATLRIATDRADQAQVAEWSGPDPQELLERAERAAEEQAELEENVEIAAEKLETIAEQVAEAEEAARAAEEEHFAQVRAIADRREGVVRLLAQHEAAATQRDNATAEVERLRENAAQQQETLDGLLEDITEAEEAQRETEASGGDLEETRAQADREAAGAEERAEQLRAKQLQLERDIATAEATIAAWQDRLTPTDGAAVVVRAADKEGIETRRLAEQLHIRDGWGAAAAAVLGDAASSGIVAPLSDALISALTDAREGRAVLLDPTTPEGAEGTGATFRLETEASAGTWLLDLMDVPHDLLRPLTALLVDVVAVDSASDASKVVAADPRLRAVTKDGSVYGAGWVASGSGGTTPVELADRIAAETEGVTKKKKELGDLQAALSGALDAASDLRTAAAAARAAEQEHRALRDAAAKRLSALQKQGEAAQRQLERSSAEQQSAEQRLAQATEQLDELADRVARVDDEEHTTEPSSAERDAAALHLSQVKAMEMEARLAQRTAEERAQSTRGKAENLRRQARAEEAARKHHQQQQARRAAAREMATCVREQSRRIADRIADALATAEANRSHTEQAHKQWQSTMAQQRDKVSALTAHLGRMNDNAHSAELARTQAQVKIEQAVAGAMEQLGLTAEQLLAEELPEDFDAAATKAELKKAEKALNSLGKVNPLALEEFKALEERYNFLAQQLDDVERARNDLHEVIADVDATILQLFTEAWQDVEVCLLYTSPSPRDGLLSRMPSSA